MSEDRLIQKLEGISSLLTAGGQDGPNPFRPPLAPLASCPLADSAGDHDRAQGPLGGVVGRLDVRRGQEGKVGGGGLAVAEALGQGLGLGVGRGPAGGFQKATANPVHRPVKSRRGHFLPPVQGVEQFSQPRQELVAPPGHGPAGLFGQESDLADQGGQAELCRRAGRLEVGPVGREKVAADDAAERFAQDLPQHVRAPRRDRWQRR